MKECRIPRVVLCGLRGGTGKTIITLGLIGAWRKRGLRVVPFKKGPDYIDPAWLSLAAARPCRNLDSFFFARNRILRIFEEHSLQADLAAIEGNRGIYDGLDAEGTHSTAQLAILLKAPVILIVNCNKASRTPAAIVLGCREMDRRLNLAGVILNHVAGSRHEAVARTAIEKTCNIPVLGALPRVEGLSFGERHLGLVPPAEHPDAALAIHEATELVLGNVDIERVTEIARSAPPLPLVERDTDGEMPTFPGVRIGVVRDEAFNFYYPENLEDLRRGGAEIIEINSLRDRTIPQVDGVYIGGGFPETHAAALASNVSFRETLLARAQVGLPILAECGGLVYLCESMAVNGKVYPMVGLFPVTWEVARRPQGHGYTEVIVDTENPFFEAGTTLRGHEFRYSRVLHCSPGKLRTVFCVKRGEGFDGGRDGLTHKNVLASFCHFHSRGSPAWSTGLLKCAWAYSHETGSELLARRECVSSQAVRKNGNQYRS